MPPDSMLCSGSAGPFQRGWMDGDRQAVVGEGERLPGTKRGGAGRGHVEDRQSCLSGHTRLSVPHGEREAAMPRLTVRELAEMTHGQVVQGPDVVTSSVVIDSREVKPDSVFFAIRGERLDGHQFLAQALATAPAAVVSQ